MIVEIEFVKDRFIKIRPRVVNSGLTALKIDLVTRRSMLGVSVAKEIELLIGLVT